MRAIPPRHRAWAGVGAFLTLLAIGLVAPGSARADCSHPGDRPAIAGDLFGLDARPADLPTRDQAPRPKPCSGPQCSGKSAPSPSTVPQAPPRSELWATLVPIEPTDGANPAGWAREGSPAIPAHLGPSIFHPPRSVR